MKICLVSLVSLFVFNFNAIAQEAPASQPAPASAPTATSIPVATPVAAEAPVASTKSVDETHGRDNRFSLMYEALGYGPEATIARGVSAGFYLTPSNLLSIEYTVGWGINFDDWGNGHIDSNTVGVTYRHFTNKSFYIKGGLLYRTLSWSDIHDDNFYSSATTRYLNGNSTALEVAIGNRWNIHHFSIGVDWVGYVQPLFTTTTSQFNATDGARDQYLTGGTAEFCRFSLGVVF